MSVYRTWFDVDHVYPFSGLETLQSGGGDRSKNLTHVDNAHAKLLPQRPSDIENPEASRLPNRGQVLSYICINEPKNLPTLRWRCRRSCVQHVGVAAGTLSLICKLQMPLPNGFCELPSASLVEYDLSLGLEICMHMWGQR